MSRPFIPQPPYISICPCNVPTWAVYNSGYGTASLYRVICLALSEFDITPMMFEDGLLVEASPECSPDFVGFVHYDDADCDGLCLMGDIAEVLGIEE